MTTYTAPIKDMQFVMKELAGLEDVAQLPGYEEVTFDLVDSVLEGAATFASEVWAPLNKVGDTEGLKWSDGVVTTPGVSWKRTSSSSSPAGMDCDSIPTTADRVCPSWWIRQ